MTSAIVQPPSFEAPERADPRWRPGDVLLVVAILGTLLLAQHLLLALGGQLRRYHGLSGVLLALFPTIGTALAVLTLAYRRRLTPARLGFVRPRSWRPPFIAWVGAIAVGPAFSGLIAVFGVQAWEPFRVAEVLAGTTIGSWQMVAWYAVGVVLIAPLVEEVVFRGMLYRAVRQRWSVPPALVLSGLVFGGAHFEPLTLVPLICVGMLFGWAYERSGSLWGAIVPHAGLNLLTLVALLARTT